MINYLQEIGDSYRVTFVKFRKFIFTYELMYKGVTYRLYVGGVADDIYNDTFYKNMVWGDLKDRDDLTIEVVN